MWRAIFLAMGISLVILGTQTLVVEQVELRRMGGSAKVESRPGLFQPAGFQPTARPSEPRVFKTKDWMPWSLLAAGAIVVLYTYSLPRRVQKG